MTHNLYQQVHPQVKLFMESIGYDDSEPGDWISLSDEELMVHISTLKSFAHMLTFSTAIKKSVLLVIESMERTLSSRKAIRESATDVSKFISNAFTPEMSPRCRDIFGKGIKMRTSSSSGFPFFSKDVNDASSFVSVKDDINASLKMIMLVPYKGNFDIMTSVLRSAHIYLTSYAGQFEKEAINDIIVASQPVVAIKAKDVDYFLNKACLKRHVFIRLNDVPNLKYGNKWNAETEHLKSLDWYGYMEFLNSVVKCEKLLKEKLFQDKSDDALRIPGLPLSILYGE
jgi:hypothetical protein